MKRIVLIIPIFALFFLSGCVTKAGLQTRYYAECEEYYDAMGFYHKDCPKQLTDSIKSIFKSEPKPASPFSAQTVLQSD